MLVELRIKNFAIIDELKLSFKDGLTIFTGETGAGKSIIIDAVETLIGGRADLTLIRSGTDSASVEGTFLLNAGNFEQIEQILGREELEIEDKSISLSREFKREGRNTARINGRLVNLGLFKEVGDLLIDLHGQSEHLSLLRVHHHLELLDRFAEIEDELADYKGSNALLAKVRRQLSTLRASEKDKTDRIELLKFQVEEINAANLVTGEEQQLLEERIRLSNAENLSAQASTALDALDNNDVEFGSAVDKLGETVQALQTLSKTDETQDKLAESAVGIFDELSELGINIRRYLEKIEFNPDRLEEVEERLGLIGHLKRKYGDSIEQIIASGEEAAVELENITNAKEKILELEVQESEVLIALARKAFTLSEKRHSAADRLNGLVETELQDLRMENARFGVDFRVVEEAGGLQINGVNCRFYANGHEEIEFLVEPNPGEGLKPLVKIASGGEASRLMLALKNVLAVADKTPTLIFDEIDQGIGGRVGSVVGRKLWNLAKGHQVLCITHLAQLAGFGQQHYRVSKEIEQDRTITKVEPLSGEKRMMELAQMLGEISAGTLQSASEILQSVNEIVGNL
jgi:DNA repair protein RecN (Recombination protein N)